MADTAVLPTAFINGEKGKQDSPIHLWLVSMDSRVDIRGERGISDLQQHLGVYVRVRKKEERELQISVRMAE